MRRGRERCYSQPDYFLGNERIMKRLRRMAFRLPRYHNLDHRAVVASFWGGSVHWLKSYQRNRQCFPLKLSWGEETEQTKPFSRLVAECVKPKLRKWHGNDWISDKTWALVGQWTALPRVGKLLRARRWTKRLIWASLRNNRAACTKGVSGMIMKYTLVGERIGGWCSILTARCRKE
jgi:hypothetical protein